MGPSKSESNPTSTGPVPVLLGKRPYLISQRVEKQSSDDDEDGFDLMNLARENVRARKEETRRPPKSDSKEAEVNKRLKEMLDPMTQKLFAMLPPPKEAGGT